MRYSLFLIFLFGCSSIPQPPITPIAQPNFENKIIYGLLIDDASEPVSIVVSNRFSAADILIAKKCEEFVEGLLGTNFNVEYNNFYWAANIPQKYDAVTLMDPPKFVIFRKDLLPPNDNPYYLYSFGVTILHEWMHYHYGMYHPHVQNTIDKPADEAYRRWYVEQFRAN